jgi:signal transduction histidine kinase
VEQSRRPKPALVLSAGFGGLIIFLMAAGTIALLQLGRVQDDDARIRQNSLARLSALEEIRSEIYLSGADVRDFLLSPNSGDERTRIASLEDETRRALDRYGHNPDPAETESFRALRGEIGAYWQVIHTAFDWTPAERERLRYSFYYEQLVPRRTTMLRIADGIAAIHERGLTSQEEQLRVSASNLRRSLLITFGVALVGGLILAVSTIVLTRRLETELEQRLSETTTARAALRDLSARLVTAQEDERRELARELHDEIGQSLSAIVMESGNLEAADLPVEVHSRASSITRIAQHSLSAVRDLALLLRPSMLDDFGLVPALNWQARETTRRTGLKIRVNADEASDNLPDEYRTCIYRIVQEALNNAARHAKAKSVDILVKMSERNVSFSIADDGRGFDPKTIRGLGFLGMEERINRLGGTLRIESKPDRGTTISAELPLANPVTLARIA